MDALEVLGIVGELFSWVGLFCGLPLVATALGLRLAAGTSRPVEIVLVPRGGGTVARWFAGGGVHERALRDWEEARLAGRDSAEAYIGDRDPARMRLDARSPTRQALWTAGIVLTAVGALGFIASWLPLILG